MIKHNQSGTVSGAAVSLIFCIVLLVGALAFGAWAFAGEQDYKNHADAKIAAAVTVAKQQEDTAQDAQFAAAAKLPLRTYNGPEAYGSLVVNFPKTWSGYVDDTGTSSPLVDGYFNPGTVPSVTDQTSVFALRVQVLSESYAQTVQNLTGQQQDGTLSATAYALPKVPTVVGVEVTGTINSNNQTGTMVILPLRSQTLEIYTYGTQYLSDFNNIILPNFSFSP